MLANGGGEGLGVGEADDAGYGKADQDADRVPQKLVEDRPVPDADGDDDERRHQPVNRHMPEKAGRDQIARFRLRRLHGVADHVAVDDDTVAIHEPDAAAAAKIRTIRNGLRRYLAEKIVMSAPKKAIMAT